MRPRPSSAATSAAADDDDEEDEKDESTNQMSSSERHSYVYYLNRPDLSNDSRGKFGQLCSQRRSQELANGGTSRRSGGRNSTAAEPRWGSGGEVSRNWRQMCM